MESFALLSVLFCLFRCCAHADDVHADRPKLLYGTLWHERGGAMSDEARAATATLVPSAMRSGFRRIDTACQPRFYNEAGVGEGWTKAAAELGLARSDLWIQTKFTGLRGHDPLSRPYDADATLEERVSQSLDRSLRDLRTDYVDSLLMHSPEEQWNDHVRIWRAMEAAVDQGLVRQLGLSNVRTVEDAQRAYDEARIKPAVVQNSFHGRSNHDVKIRAFCREHGIEYQS